MVGLAALSLPGIAQQQPRTIVTTEITRGPEVEIPEGAFEITLPNLRTVGADAPGAVTAGGVIVVANASTSDKPRKRCTLVRIVTTDDRSAVDRTDDDGSPSTERVQERIIVIHGDSAVLDRGELGDVEFRLGRDRVRGRDVSPVLPPPHLRIISRDVPADVDAGTSAGGTTIISGAMNSVVILRNVVGSVVNNASAADEESAPETSAAPMPAPVISEYSRPEPELPSAIETRELANAGYSLANATPNPVSSSATISFTLPRGGDTKLMVFDNAGRVVATLADENLEQGTHTRTFDATGLPAGLYLYRLSSGSYAETKTMTVVH
jgi:hypothetical protein